MATTLYNKLHSYLFETHVSCKHFFVRYKIVATANGYTKKCFLQSERKGSSYSFIESPHVYLKPSPIRTKKMNIPFFICHVRGCSML